VNDDNLKIQASKYLDKGPYVYDLYSIVFHSGNASGGHYYVYIKSFEDSNIS
jgi:ubiquitin carboxyl-terminal hydrolase 47